MASLPRPPPEAGHQPPLTGGDRLVLAGADVDAALAGSLFLSHDEVLHRRLRRVNQLAGYYRRQYWALMEDLRSRYRRYYWDHGRGPFAGDSPSADGALDGGADVPSDGKDYRPASRCAFPACKSKAMALTRFCHAHILSDVKQKLYKPCIAPVGQITCGKPILRSLMPSLCCTHLQKHQKNVWRALKKGGLNMASSSKPPTFSIIIAEYVRQIQTKRRAARNMDVTITASANGSGNFIKQVWSSDNENLLELAESKSQFLAAGPWQSMLENKARDMILLEQRIFT